MMWLSCGSTNAPSTQTSGLKYRAFITSNVSSGTSVAGVDILDAQNDIFPGVNPIAAGNTPEMMLVTPNRAQTLVFSGSGTQFSDNQLTFINNTSEQSAAHLTLPGMTESIVVSPDSSAAYVAVPTATVIGQSPGIVEAVALGSGIGSVTGQVDVPAVRYLSINNSGNRVFGFSDNSDFVAVITPSQIGIGNALTSIGGPGVFDRPVAAFFSSDDNTAYVVSCGAECGGTQAGLQQFNLTTNTLVASTPACVSSTTQCGASVAMVDGSTMYLAGSYANPSATQPCTPAQTLFTVTCGVLTIVDLTTMQPTATGIAITDGYHNRIVLGANGQLFVAAVACTEAAGVSGCLSIYNTTGVAVGSVPPLGVLIPSANGDVTGLQPIATRQVVYVVQGGSLYIYDTTNDALEYNPHDPNNPGQIFGLVGYFIDVKTIDF